MFKNNEGYVDPTAGEALSQMMREYRKQQKKKWVHQYKLKHREKIYVISPYAGQVDINVPNAIRYSRYVIECGGMPITSHLLYPQLLDDEKPEERELDIMFGLALLALCEECWVFGEEITSGMAREITEAKRLSIPLRYIHAEDLP